MDLLVFFIDWCRHFLNFPTLPISLRYSFILSVSFLECQSSWDERFNGCLELCWFFWKWVTIIHVIASVAVRKPSAGFTTAIVKEKKRGRTRRHPLNFDWRKKIERNMIGQWSPSRPLTRWPRWRIKKEKTHTHTHTHTHTQPAMEFRTRDVTEERPIAEEKSCPPLLGLQVKLEKPYVSFPPASINTNEEASQGTKKNKKRTLDPLTSLTFERTRSITSGFSQSSLKNKKKSTVAGKRLHNCWLLSTIQWNRKNNYSVKSFKRTESITSGFNQT